MIKPPHRSVTRFFIPLIDVLTLLFCIFLVMPLATDAQDKARADNPSDADRIKALEKELDKAREQLAQAKARLDRLERERLEQLKAVVEQLAIGVVEVDGKDGTVFYRSNGQRVVLKDASGVAAMADADRKKLGPRREWLYVLRYPEDPAAPHPNLRDELKIDTWFKEAKVRLSLEGEIEERKGRPK